MAACRSLQHIFEKPLKESPFETLSSWSPIKSMKPIDNSSFAEIFGELNFQENHHDESNTDPPSSSTPYPASPPSSVSSSSTSLSGSNNHQLIGIERLFRDNDEIYKTPFSPSPKKQYSHGNSFSSMSSEALSHCTEGLGFESSDEVEDYGNDNISLDWRHRREEKQGANVVQERSEYMYCDHRRSRVNRGSFPPPISCIGSNGKPFVSFKSYRENGRFILKEVRIPQQEFLRASRENGRLKLQLIHSDDDIFEEEEFYDEDDDDDDDDNEEYFDLKDMKEVYEEDTKEDDSINEEVFHLTNVDDEEQEVIDNYKEETETPCRG